MDDHLIRAAVLREVGGPVELREVTLLAPRAGEVRIKVRAVGVCHSDLSVQSGVIPYQTPCVLGHECAGEILDIGPGVTDWQVGDRVVVQWVPMCRECRSCRRGEPHLCSTYLRVGGRMDDGETRFREGEQELVHGINVGGYSDEVVVRQTAITALPGDVPFETGAVIGCGFLTGWGSVNNIAKATKDEAVAIFGAGGVGLSAAMAARAAGAIVAVFDPQEERRELASGVLEHAVKVAHPDDAVGVMKELAGDRPDVAIDAVGRAKVQLDALSLVRPGGRVVIAGVNPTETIEMPGYAFGIQSKRVLGAWFGGCDPQRDLPAVLDGWRDGSLPIDRLITSVRPLTEVALALDDLRQARGIRTVLVP
ncbi:MAG: alcohol dehydrogenase catalytic domain-containing protein [Actinomycetota bacterium]